MTFLSGTHYLPPEPPAGMPESTIHGSVPCSNWEITSGLETWSPAHEEEKKDRYLSAVREMCQVRIPFTTLSQEERTRRTDPMGMNSVSSISVTNSLTRYNLGTDLGSEKLLVCPTR